MKNPFIIHAGLSFDGACNVPADINMNSSVHRAQTRQSQQQNNSQSCSMSSPSPPSFNPAIIYTNLHSTMNRDKPRTRRSKSNKNSFRQLGVLSSSGGGFAKAADMNAKTKHAEAAATINKQTIVVGFSGLVDTEMELLVS